MSQVQYKRKATLVVSASGTTTGLDLSEAHFRFSTSSQDVESPAACFVRVYNLSDATMNRIRGEFDRVTLQAGYESNYGVIFDGSIKQYRLGRENATDRYIDILAADGDLGYNYSTINKTLAAGWTQEQTIKEAVAAMLGKGVTEGFIDSQGLLGGTVPNPRGKVLFGLPRVILRQATASVGASWNIDQGKVNVIGLESYKPGEVVVLNALTGLIGLPEQTLEGVRARCLINPKLTVGGLVQIDNKSINQTVQQNPDAAPIPFNQWTGLQLLATVSKDGLYRVFTTEHEGDTRGNAWYTNLVCLAVNPSTQKVEGAL